MKLASTPRALLVLRCLRLFTSSFSSNSHLLVPSPSPSPAAVLKYNKSTIHLVGTFVHGQLFRNCLNNERGFVHQTLPGQPASKQYAYLILQSFWDLLAMYRMTRTTIVFENRPHAAFMVSWLELVSNHSSFQLQNKMLRITSVPMAPVPSRKSSS